MLGGVAIDEHFLFWNIIFIFILDSSFLGVWFVPLYFLFQSGLVTDHLWLLHDFLSELFLFITEFTAMTETVEKWCFWLLLAGMNDLEIVGVAMLMLLDVHFVCVIVNSYNKLVLMLKFALLL